MKKGIEKNGESNFQRGGLEHCLQGDSLSSWQYGFCSILSKNSLITQELIRNINKLVIQHIPVVFSSHNSLVNMKSDWTFEWDRTPYLYSGIVNRAFLFDPRSSRRPTIPTFIQIKVTLIRKHNLIPSHFLVIFGPCEATVFLLQG